MKTTSVPLPDDLLELLARSRVGTRPRTDQVRATLAIALFQQGLVSVAKAAELAGESRASFEALLSDMGVPVVEYGETEYEEDLRGLRAARRETHAQ
ncbi:MAG TPA: UPF0175 family protein [Chloroflexota bacterium]|nr:UPF0175 family protein [Chloroflexota bacterium]